MTTTYVNPNGQLLPSHCQRTSGVTLHGQYRSVTYVIEGSCEVLPNGGWGCAAFRSPLGAGVQRRRPPAWGRRRARVGDCCCGQPSEPIILAASAAWSDNGVTLSTLK
jgi:hypothetical protein